MIELTAAKDDDGRRLDRIIRKALPDYPLSLIHRLLRQKKILVDNEPATPNHRIKQGMVIRIIAPANHNNTQVNPDFVNHEKTTVNKKNPRLQTPNPKPQTLTPGPQPPIPILWQGSGIIVFNKPRGLSTHGSVSLDSIVNARLAEEGALPCSLSFRPGPLHRLDKPTSGAIAFSQTLEGARLFSALLREHKLEKIYIAIIEGRIEDEESWQDDLAHDKKMRKSFVKTHPPVPSPQSLVPIKEALTAVKTLASNDRYSLIEAKIKTGRHHHIRAQACSHGHPLAGDIKYGGHTLPGQSRGGEFFLHAWKIKFNESPDGFPQEITAPLPEAFQAQIETLFGEYDFQLSSHGGKKKDLPRS
jgi:23S rRNA pseudouridine955/2504/2580 synthase